MTSIKSNFSSNLQQLRTTKGILPKDLSNQTGIREETLSYYEFGIRLPKSIDNLLKISEKLQVSTDYLLKKDTSVKFISMGANVNFNKANFANKLRSRRKSFPYTQQEIAELANMDVRTYQYYESNNVKRKPSCEYLVQLSIALKISIEELIK